MMFHLEQELKVCMGHERNAEPPSGMSSKLQRREDGQTDGRKLLGRTCLFSLKTEFLFMR